MGPRHFISAAMGCLLLVGCAAPGQQVLPFGVSRIVDGDRSATFAAAEATLVGMGYVIEVSDPSTGRITTRAMTQARRPERQRKAVRISAQSELRRVIQLRVGETEESVNIYCQVAIQEQDTEAHRIMQQQLTTSDRAGETAIDRDAGTTIEQNTVWRTIDRDKALERKILNTVLDRVGASPSADGSSSGQP